MQHNPKMRNSPNITDVMKPANRKYEIVYLVCTVASAHMLTHEMETTGLMSMADCGATLDNVAGRMMS